MTTLMWEAVAADVEAVLAWARAFEADGMTRKEVYVADAGGRVVVITDWTADPPGTLTPPSGTLLRDGHAWTFRRVS